MRIVGGKHRSRVLKEFKGDAVRPTADKVRESLFNILQTQTEGATFLDLFGGTGAVGIEALSRGAKKVVFTDSSSDSIKLIKENLVTFIASDVHYSRKQCFLEAYKFVSKKFSKQTKLAKKLLTLAKL